jgi:hypothetical protein
LKRVSSETSLSPKTAKTRSGRKINKKLKPAVRKNQICGSDKRVDGLSMGFRGNQKEREREREKKKKKKKKKAYLHGSMGAQLFCTGGNGEIKRRGGTREEL